MGDANAVSQNPRCDLAVTADDLVNGVGLIRINLERGIVTKLTVASVGLRGGRPVVVRTSDADFWTVEELGILPSDSGAWARGIFTILDDPEAIEQVATIISWSETRYAAEVADYLRG